MSCYVSMLWASWLPPWHKLWQVVCSWDAFLKVLENPKIPLNFRQARPKGKVQQGLFPGPQVFPLALSSLLILLFPVPVRLQFG